MAVVEGCEMWEGGKVQVIIFQKDGGAGEFEGV